MPRECSILKIPLTFHFTRFFLKHRHDGLFCIIHSIVAQVWADIHAKQFSIGSKDRFVWRVTSGVNKYKICVRILNSDEVFGLGISKKRDDDVLVKVFDPKNFTFGNLQYVSRRNLYTHDGLKLSSAGSGSRSAEWNESFYLAFISQLRMGSKATDDEVEVAKLVVTKLLQHANEEESTRTGPDSEYGGDDDSDDDHDDDDDDDADLASHREYHCVLLFC